MNVRKELDRRISEALEKAGAPAGTPGIVVPSARAEFGDYQANGVMAAAKTLKTNPRQLAQKVLDAASLGDIAEKAEIAGPGFINITLRPQWLAAQLGHLQADERLGVDRPENPQHVVVDYSAPNLAKEMHVGHLRPTVIGDAMARMLEFIGHDVTRQNHVGDWGTQFGMLIAYMDRVSGDAGSHIADLEEFYRQAKRLFDEDESFARTARETVVKLQGGDERVKAIWRQFVDESLRHCEQVYGKLDVTLQREHVVGESFYNDQLPGVVDKLDNAGLLTQSDGAKCVFLDEFKGKDDKPLPVIVQKSDGGFLYATSDLAAVGYRVNELHAGRILYVIDARQSLHLRQVFAVARKAGFAPPQVSLEHIAFGTIMGPDGRPFKTREGGTVKLMDLLTEAESRAYELVKQKNPDLDEQRMREVARVVGIGAVKYADLSTSRTSDYVFSWERMLSLDGNTAPYMQYAYARIRSIFRKGGLSDDAPAAAIAIQDPAERVLAVKLMQLGEVLHTVVGECLPNLLCNYLFELAGAFMGFYESCPVLASEQPIRTSRLMLCRLTARTIRTGLDLLGIRTLEQM